MGHAALKALALSMALAPAGAQAQGAVAIGADQAGVVAGVTFLPGGPSSGKALDYAGAVPLPLPSSTASPGVSASPGVAPSTLGQGTVTAHPHGGVSIGSVGSGKLDLRQDLKSR